MEFIDFTKLLIKKRGTIFIIVFIAMVFTAGLSLIVPLKYGAKSRLLVVQNTQGSDAYTVSKSNEYLGNLFAEVANSGSFYNFVLSSQYNIDKNYFAGNYNEQIKIWKKTIETKTLSDTGIVEINIYHPNPYQAQQLALAVNDIMINKNSSYQGNGNGIKISIIDQPLISNYPIKPNLIQNILVAGAGGLMLSLFFIYLFPEERYSLHILPKRRAKKIKNKEHSIKIDYYPVNDSDNIENSPTTDEPRLNSSNQNSPENHTWHGDINGILK